MCIIIMLDIGIAKCSIHTLNFEQIEQQGRSSNKGVARHLRPTLKHPLSKFDSPQEENHKDPNILNKEFSINSNQKDCHVNSKAIKISHVSINLPEIRRSPTRAESEVYEQKSAEIVSYSSGKLPSHKDKFLDNVKNRYYQKIEVMKEIKTPAITHQFFSLPHSHSNKPASFAKDANYGSEVPKVIKKALANFPYQKYQILKQKQQALIPKQLQAKRFRTRYAFNTIATESKNAIRFKFDSMFSKQKRSVKIIDEPYDIRQIEGWQSEANIGFQHQVMFN